MRHKGSLPSKKPSRKHLENHIRECHISLQKQKQYIDEECTPKDSVLAIYCAMRVAISEVYGQEGVEKVLAAVRDTTAQEKYELKEEALQTFSKKQLNI